MRMYSERFLNPTPEGFRGVRGVLGLRLVHVSPAPILLENHQPSKMKYVGSSCAITGVLRVFRRLGKGCSHMLTGLLHPNFEASKIRRHNQHAQCTTIGWVLPALVNSCIISIMWLYIALDMNPIIEKSWVGAGPTV